MAKYAQGKFAIQNPTKYIGNRAPTYRSSWEFHFMQFCDSHPSVSKWSSEAIRIPYRNPFTNKNTIYVPDSFIVYTDKTGSQHAELIEVKPASQTIREKVGKNKNDQAHFILNQYKWQAATAWCKQQGIAFRVVNENDIFHNGKRR